MSRLSNNVRLMLGVVSAALLVGGCRPIPAEFARIMQFETFTLTFELEPGEAKGVFEKLLGKENWEYLDGRWEYLFYGKDGTKADDISAFVDNLEIKGHTALQISLLPSDLESFVVEGMGRFFVLLKTEQQDQIILLTADFSIIDEQHTLGELDDGELTIGLKLHYVQFSDPDPTALNYVNDSPFAFKFFVDTSMAKHDIYSLDYSQDKHEALLDGKVIGYIKLGQPKPSYRKLIDLHGVRRFIRNNYREKYRESSNQ